MSCAKATYAGEGSFCGRFCDFYLSLTPPRNRRFRSSHKGRIFVLGLLRYARNDGLEKSPIWKSDLLIACFSLFGTFLCWAESPTYILFNQLNPSPEFLNSLCSLRNSSLSRRGRESIFLTLPPHASRIKPFNSSTI